MDMFFPAGPKVRGAVLSAELLSSEPLRQHALGKMISPIPAVTRRECVG